jgi:pimeloyl-ACP methyl ester carboxylesterase
MSESPNTPTVVLVHGGFADASFWAPVIESLQAHDLPVLAPPNPLRGLGLGRGTMALRCWRCRRIGPRCSAAGPRSRS